MKSRQSTMQNGSHGKCLVVFRWLRNHLRIWNFCALLSSTNPQHTSQGAWLVNFQNRGVASIWYSNLSTPKFQNRVSDLRLKDQRVFARPSEWHEKRRNGLPPLWIPDSSSCFLLLYSIKIQSNLLFILFVSNERGEQLCFTKIFVARNTHPRKRGLKEKKTRRVHRDARETCLRLMEDYLQIITQPTIFPLIFKHLDNSYPLSLTCSLIRQQVFGAREKDRCSECKLQGFFCWKRPCDHSCYETLCISTGFATIHCQMVRGRRQQRHEFRCSNHVTGCFIDWCYDQAGLYGLCNYHNDSARCSFCQSVDAQPWSVCARCNDRLLCADCRKRHRGHCDQCALWCPVPACNRFLSQYDKCSVCSIGMCEYHSNRCADKGYCVFHYEACNHWDSDNHFCGARTQVTCEDCGKFQCSDHVAPCGSHCRDCCLKYPCHNLRDWAVARAQQNTKANVWQPPKQ